LIILFLGYYYSYFLVVEPQLENIGLGMLLVVGAGGGTSQASRNVNGSATQLELAE
jgi:hypothetical protein